MKFSSSILKIKTTRKILELRIQSNDVDIKISLKKKIVYKYFAYNIIIDLLKMYNIL